MGQISTFYPNPGPSQAEKFCKEEIRMRNLKRALSLTLASVMLLGMMVIGTSAAAGYDDVKETDNVEAIEVLQAVEVMVGDDRGFGPDRPVTRAEMAVVMGKLLNLDYNYYVSTCPFADVSGNFEWARGWVGAAYANKILSGRGEGVFDPASTVTAVEAASMMMRALGYFKYTEDVADGFQLATVRQGNQIGIFNGVGTDATTPMTRNQVAQMALNALRSNMVEFTGTPGIEVNGVKVGYRAEYTPRTSPEAKYNAIADLATTILTDNGQYYVQLGEELYDGDLRLNDKSTDDFARPARYWEYDGKAIGTYAKTELIRKEYTTAVSGRDLYELLSADVVKNYSFTIAIDGITEHEIDSNVFNTSAINRNNKSAVGGTGNGVLTQVFVDTNKAKKEVTIAIINTYLAIASRDYDAKKETLDLTVYGLSRDSDKNLIKTITAASDSVNIDVSSEDFDVVDVKKNDTFLVNVADSTVQIMTDVAPMAGVEITSFQSRNLTKNGSGNLTTGGQKYDFSDAAEYSNDTLVAYTGENNSAIVNLKDLTYDVYLDAYDYVIGVVEVDKPTNYVFISGVNSGDNNLASVTLEANAIFTDGTMKKIEINRKDSPSFVARVNALNTAGGKGENSTFNRWCTYTVGDNGIYALSLVTENAGAGKVGQSHTKDRTAVIDEKNISIDTVSTGGSVISGGTNGLAYGNNKSVYLSVEVEEILTTTGRTDCIVSDVDSVVTGIGNVNVKPLNGTAARDAADDTNASANTITEGVYTLYGDDGYVIAMIVVGEDNGSNSDLVYVHNESVAQEYLETDKDGKRTYRWERTVIIDGVEATLTEVNDARISMLNKMDANNWYRVRRDSNNNVTSVLGSHDGGIDDDYTPNNLADGIKNWGFTATTAPIAYNTNYDGSTTLVDSMKTGGVTTVLYHEAFFNEKPSAKEQTMYVTQSLASGIRFAKDVKVVLDQENAKKRETFFGEGEEDLKDFLKDLHPNTAGGTAYDYEISAVIEGPSATSIVIRDLVSDGNSGSVKPPVDVTGAKAAITGADTPTAGGTALKIGYLTDSDKPETAEDVQAIVEEWAKVMGWTLGDVQGTPSIGAGEIFWGVTNKLGAQLGNVKLDTATGIVQGIRVIYTDADGDPNSNPGYEIVGTVANASKLNTNSDGDVTSLYIKSGAGTAYTKAMAPGATTWTWSAKKASNDDNWTDAGEYVVVDKHDFKVCVNAATAKVELDGTAYYGTAGTTNIAAATGALVTADKLKAGDNIMVNKSGTITFVTKTAAATTTIADGDVYESGYVKVTKDATNIDKVEATGVVTPTADAAQFYVPANSSITVTLKAAADAKSWQLSDGTTSFGAPFTAANPGSLVMPATQIGAKDVTLDEVKAVVFKPDVANGKDGMTIAWTVNGKAVSGTVYVGSADSVKAVVTFGNGYTDADTGAADTLVGTATCTSGTMPSVGTGTSGTITLVTTAIASGATAEFYWTGAAAGTAGTLEITLNENS